MAAKWNSFKLLQIREFNSRNSFRRNSPNKKEFNFKMTKYRKFVSFFSLPHHWTKCPIKRNLNGFRRFYDHKTWILNKQITVDKQSGSRKRPRFTPKGIIKLLGIYFVSVESHDSRSPVSIVSAASRKSLSTTKT